MNEFETKDVKETPTTEDKSRPLVTGTKVEPDRHPVIHVNRDLGDEDQKDG